MTIEFDRDTKKFLESISAFEPAYSFQTFGFVAIEVDRQYLLVRGELSLGVVPSRLPPKKFKHSSIIAGRFLLGECNLSLAPFLESIFEGEIKTPFGKIVTKFGDRPDLSTFFQPYHYTGPQKNMRVNHLSISGSNLSQYKNNLHIDWNLRAANPPYSSLQDLLLDFGIIDGSSSISAIDVYGDNVAFVRQDSKVHNDVAILNVVLANNLNTSLMALGLIKHVNGNVEERCCISGNEFEWKECNGMLIGAKQIPVKRSTVLEVFASYAEIAQTHSFIFDPDAVPNTRRVAYEAFDPQLEGMKELLQQTNKRGQNARDFESSVAWLLWMHGFNVAHLGATGLTQDAVDLICETPNGNLAVVECTTGILKSESKLSLLIERTEKLSKHLEGSGNINRRILPILITNKNRDAVKADLEPARQHGVVVLTCEDIERLVQNTILLPRPNDLFREAEESLTQSDHDQGLG